MNRKLQKKKKKNFSKYLKKHFYFYFYFLCMSNLKNLYVTHRTIYLLSEDNIINKYILFIFKVFY